MSDYLEIRDRMRKRLPSASARGVDLVTARTVLDIVAAELVAMRATNVPPGSLHTVDGFVPGLGTVRDCLDCGCLVSGGPTRCKRCACAVEWPPGGDCECWGNDCDCDGEAAAAGDTFPPYGPPQPQYLNTPEEPIDYASDAIDRACRSCGAEPGQQCSDTDGTEYAMFVHPERTGSTCVETVTRGLFDEAVALLRRAMVHVAPSGQRDEIRAFLRDVDEFPCCCESCAAERASVR